MAMSHPKHSFHIPTTVTGFSLSLFLSFLLSPFLSSPSGSHFLPFTGSHSWVLASWAPCSGSQTGTRAELSWTHRFFRSCSTTFSPLALIPYFTVSSYLLCKQIEVSENALQQLLASPEVLLECQPCSFPPLPTKTKDAGRSRISRRSLWFWGVLIRGANLTRRKLVEKTHPKCFLGWNYWESLSKPSFPVPFCFLVRFGLTLSFYYITGTNPAGSGGVWVQTPPGTAQSTAALSYWLHLIQIKVSTGY